MEQTKANTAEELLMTIEECRTIVAKGQGLESWYALTYSNRAFNSKQWVTTMSDKAAELYASQFKSCISYLEEQNEELRSDLHDTRSILGLVDPLRANLEAQNKELREALEWIPITDRLPDVQVPVLVYLPKYGTPNINTMWIEEMSGQWFNTAWQFKRLDEVTHWMPLPEKPKGGKQDG